MDRTKGKLTEAKYYWLKQNDCEIERLLIDELWDGLENKLKYFLKNANKIILDIESAKKILDLIDIAYSEGQLSDVKDIMKAIASQHPHLVKQYSYLPWGE